MTVSQPLLETLDDPVAGTLMVYAEGELSPVELSDPLPLRVPVRVEDPLADTDTVCVPERDTAELLVAVAAPELLFDVETEAV